MSRIRQESNPSQLKARGGQEETHVTESESIPSNTLASFEEVVHENETITLKPEDFRTFLTALDAPIEPSPELQTAFKRHSEQVLK